MGQTQPAGGAGTEPPKPAAAAATASAPAKDDAVLATMKSEMQRSLAALKKTPTPPYFLSYQLTDNRALSVQAAFGALVDSKEQRSRMLDLDLRVGDPKLDNTHNVDSEFSMSTFGQVAGQVPLENDEKALSVALWLETDRYFKHAVQRLEAVKTSGQLKPKTKEQPADFSAAKPESHMEPEATLEFDRPTWEEKVRKWGKKFRGNPHILRADITASGELETRRYVNSEGSEIRISSPLYRIDISATIKAEDGDVLPLYRSYLAYSTEGLPSDETVEKTIQEMLVTLAALRTAPVGEAYTGPAVLSGRASAVFFHEIFGHRIEGARLKDEDDANTFRNKINQAVLPRFLSVYSDPTLKRYRQEDLVGFYAFDDEGVRARRIPVVEKGIFRNFLMSRSPLEGFPESNGHGRRQQGYMTAARQANLVVEAAQTVSRAQLKKLLIDRVKAAKKPYGLLFEDIHGGYTFTSRALPNAFSVLPTVVYRVYPDGREELIRGLDLIGTPLIAFSKISAADDQPGVFNGICGAESGWVPVSAVSPGLLVDQIELQRKAKSEEETPILPAPSAVNQEQSR